MEATLSRFAKLLKPTKLHSSVGRGWWLPSLGAIALAVSACQPAAVVDDDDDDDPDSPAESEEGDSSPLDGPATGDASGCAAAPSCDRGPYSGHMILEGPVDVAEWAGYTSLTGELRIRETNLVCLNFLACLETVGTDLSVYGNPYLEDISGLNSIQDIGVATADRPLADWKGTLSVSENAALVRIDSFDSLIGVRQSLIIQRNDRLEEIAGFGAFTIVQQDLTIRENPNLAAIPGLSGLRAVRGAFNVAQNPNLCIQTINQVASSLEEGPSSNPATTANKDC